MTYPWAIVIASVILGVASIMVTGLRWSAKVSISNNDLEIKKFDHHLAVLKDTPEESEPIDGSKL